MESLPHINDHQCTRVCVIWRKQKLQGAGTSGRDKAKMELICEFFQLSLNKAAVLHVAQARNTSAVMLDWHQHQIRGACSRTWRSIPCGPGQNVYNTSHIGSRKEDTCNSHIRIIPGTFIKHTIYITQHPSHHSFRWQSCPLSQWSSLQRALSEL